MGKILIHVNLNIIFGSPQFLSDKDHFKKLKTILNGLTRVTKTLNGEKFLKWSKN